MMKDRKHSKRNILSLFVFTALWCLVSTVGFYMCFPDYYFNFYPIIPFYFFLFTTFIYYEIKVLRQKKLNMVIAFLGLKMIKLFVSILVLALCCWLLRQLAIEFIIAFVINYLVYLGVDVKIWQRSSRTALNNSKAFLLLAFLLTPFICYAQEEGINQKEEQQNTVDVKEIVFSHLGDSYEWHITNIGHKELIVPLPIIVRSKTTGWHIFLSSKLHQNGGIYEGFYIAPLGSEYEGKVVYEMDGRVQRPIDLSITKVAASLLFNSFLLIIIILCVARWYRKHDITKEAPKGFVGFMEMIILMINDDIVKGCVGPKWRKFSPYLLTAFFFILFNNVVGLIPFFPWGVNVTGNIAITMVLAICTFLAINIFGTKHYWKEVFWPDVPWWLKVPIPMMPFIELFGIFTKPFALMIRLFANMLSGHMAMLVLTSLIFISASMGAAMITGFTVASVLFNIFMNALELLVAFIQAYVFTMLSAVFIGLAQEHGRKDKNEEI